MIKHIFIYSIYVCVYALYIIEPASNSKCYVLIFCEQLERPYTVLSYLVIYHIIYEEVTNHDGTQIQRDFYYFQGGTKQ